MQKHVSDIRNLLWSTIVLQLGWFQNHLYVEIHQKTWSCSQELCCAFGGSDSETLDSQGLIASNVDRSDQGACDNNFALDFFKKCRNKNNNLLTLPPFSEKNTTKIQHNCDFSFRNGNQRCTITLVVPKICAKKNHILDDRNVLCARISCSWWLQTVIVWKASVITNTLSTLLLLYLEWNSNTTVVILFKITMHCFQLSNS